MLNASNETSLLTVPKLIIHIDNAWLMIRAQCVSKVATETVSN